MFLHYVYRLRRADSEFPFYIGKGKGSRRKRHFDATQMAKVSWKTNMIRQAWSEGVEVLSEIVVAGLSDKRAIELEIGLIAFYGRRDKGTGILANMTDGGEGPAGQIISESQRKRQSELLKGRKASEETRAKMSAAHKARVRKPLSEEAKKSQRAAQLARLEREGRNIRPESVRVARRLKDAERKLAKKSIQDV